jgi:RNA polymerase sigma-70 factor (ECF subfamily)
MTARVVAATDSTQGSPDASDDAALVERARIGDRAAFGALYDRFSPILFGAAIRFFRDRREADDLVHDVFLEAWQHVREYDATKGSIRTWFLLRLRSRALDRMGRAEARKTRLLEDGADMPEPTVPGTDAIDVIAVRRALEGLDQDVRGVLERTYFEGLTAREIAEQANVPVGTVKSRLARGLSALGVALRGEGEIG